MSTSLVTIRLHSARDPAQKAWLSMRVSAREDQHIHFQADIETAMARDAISFLHPINDAQAKVVKADIVGGIMLARKAMGRRGFVVELHSLGGSTGAQGSILQIATVAFGVAANLAVLHGLGVEDLVAHPHGGYGWELSEITTQPWEDGVA
jgi:hypothetical protein